MGGMEKKEETMVWNASQKDVHESKAEAKCLLATPQMDEEVRVVKNKKCWKEFGRMWNDEG